MIFSRSRCSVGVPLAATCRKSTVDLETILFHLSLELLRRAFDSTLLLETMKVIVNSAYHHLNQNYYTKVHHLNRASISEIAEWSPF